MRERFARLDVVPFETAMAAVALVSGFLGLIGIHLLDPLGAVLPSWMATGFQFLYLAAGLLMLVGVFLGSFRIEGVGVVLLGTGLVVREIVYVYYLGLHADAITSAVFYAAFLWACRARLQTLRRGETIVRIALPRLHGGEA